MRPAGAGSGRGRGTAWVGRVWRRLCRWCVRLPPYLRRICSCITQLKAQGPSRACNESQEEEEEDRLTAQILECWRFVWWLNLAKSLYGVDFSKIFVWCEAEEEKRLRRERLCGISRSRRREAYAIESPIETLTTRGNLLISKHLQFKGI